jgi:hypothetical protein
MDAIVPRKVSVDPLLFYFLPVLRSPEKISQDYPSTQLIFRLRLSPSQATFHRHRGLNFLEDIFSASKIFREARRIPHEALPTPASSTRLKVHEFYTLCHTFHYSRGSLRYLQAFQPGLAAERLRIPAEGRASDRCA